MKEIKYVTFLNVIFLLLIFLSGGASGLGSEALYLLAFVLPLAISVAMHRVLRREREEQRGAREITPRLFMPTRAGLGLFLPLAVPTVVLTLAVSNGVGLALTAMGFEAPMQEAGNILTDLLRSALLPAVAEEALFRLVPLLLIAPRTRRGAFTVMTVYFALAHGSLFSIPYALVAGAVLAFITLATGNIVYAVLIHLVNNVTSVLLMHYGTSSVFLAVSLSALGILCVVSTVFIVLNRKGYREAIARVTDRGELKAYPKAFYIYTALTALLAISQLLV